MNTRRKFFTVIASLTAGLFAGLKANHAPSKTTKPIGWGSRRYTARIYERDGGFYYKTPEGIECEFICCQKHSFEKI